MNQKKSDETSKQKFRTFEIEESTAGTVIPENLKTTVAKEAGHIYYTNGMKKSLWHQWVRVSLIEVLNAFTYGEACMVWENAPTMSFVKNIALEKMLSLTEDEKRVMHIFRIAPKDSLVSYLAFDKLQRIKKA